MGAARFAPSPTGYLHKGHAFSALTAFETARRLGGRFVLRIEDIDFTRCRPEFEVAISEDLAWLGLDWEIPLLRHAQGGRRGDAQRPAWCAGGLSRRTAAGSRGGGAAGRRGAVRLAAGPGGRAGRRRR